MGEGRLTLEDAAIFCAHADYGAVVVFHDEAECHLQNCQFDGAEHEKLVGDVQTCRRPLCLFVSASG
jgi:hypothetical protein